jgi:hypothetical protein
VMATVAGTQVEVFFGVESSRDWSKSRKPI